MVLGLPKLRVLQQRLVNQDVLSLGGEGDTSKISQQALPLSSEHFLKMTREFFCIIETLQRSSLNQ